MRFINFTELYWFKCLLACSCVGLNPNPKLLNPTRWRFILLVIFNFYNTIVFACREIIENISRCINKQCWTRNICCSNGMHGSKNLIKICSSSFGQNSLFRIFWDSAQGHWTFFLCVTMFAWVRLPAFNFPFHLLASGSWKTFLPTTFLQLWLFFHALRSPVGGDSLVHIFFFRLGLVFA